MAGCPLGRRHREVRSPASVSVRVTEGSLDTTLGFSFLPPLVLPGESPVLRGSLAPRSFCTGYSAPLPFHDLTDLTLAGSVSRRHIQSRADGAVPSVPSAWDGPAQGAQGPPLSSSGLPSGYRLSESRASSAVFPS